MPSIWLSSEQVLPGSEPWIFPAPSKLSCIQIILELRTTSFSICVHLSHNVGKNMDVSIFSKVTYSTVLSNERLPLQTANFIASVINVTSEYVCM